MRQISVVYLLCLFFIPVQLLKGQEQKDVVKTDTSIIAYKLIKNGRIFGRARNYLSATVNQGELTDYFAWAAGAGIGYESPVFFRHFSMGISGFTQFNLWASDMLKPDPTTRQVNRYEVGLFNIEDPNSGKDQTRLEELYFRFRAGRKLNITAGRQYPSSPFLNVQDGRMQPTLIEAVVTDWKPTQNLAVHAEYIGKISPRSTIKWFSVGNSMGVYPMGVNPDGSVSAYKNNITTYGIGVLGLTFTRNNWQIQLWNTYLDQVLNTAFAQFEWRSVPQAGFNWFAGAQAVFQHTLANGGNPDPAKTYALPGAGAQVYSGRFGRQAKSFSWFVNLTRITDRGRFLMPREWGKEPFYTFMPRERNDGFGDLSAISINTALQLRPDLNLEISGGYYQLPDVKNYNLNKYGMPSYTQLNLSVTHKFGQNLRGLSTRLLLVRKDATGETYQNMKFIFNKVNMIHLNLITNYQF